MHGINADLLLRIAKERGFSPRSKTCPYCNSGLKVHVVPATETTVLICPVCGANATLPFIRDDGREFGEQFIPGVTGRRRPTSTYRVKMNAAGKIVGVQEVRR